MTEAVVRAALHRLRMPLLTPHRAARSEEVVRDLVLVEVERADGSIGWGECSALARPTYTAEHTGGAWLVLRDELIPAALAGRPDEVVGNPMAKAAVATALLDARLRSEGRSLASHLAAEVGLRSRRELARTAVVGLGERPGEVVEAVGRHLEAGAVAVKLKVTPQPDHLEAAVAVRGTWPDLVLAVDWNGSADRGALAVVDALGVAYHEQPAPPDDLRASAGFASATGAPVALDESVEGLGSLEAAAVLRAGSLVNLKPARVGGPLAACRIIDRLRSLGLGWFVGGMLESGVGRAAAVAVAAVADDGPLRPTDLGPSEQYVETDVAGPICVDAEGRLLVPRGPGIGIEVDLVAVAAARVDHLERS